MDKNSTETNNLALVWGSLNNLNNYRKTRNATHKSILQDGLNVRNALGHTLAEMTEYIRAMQVVPAAEQWEGQAREIVHLWQALQKRMNEELLPELLRDIETAKDTQDLLIKELARIESFIQVQPRLAEIREFRYMEHSDVKTLVNSLEEDLGGNTTKDRAYKALKPLLDARNNKPKSKEAYSDPLLKSPVRDSEGNIHY